MLVVNNLYLDIETGEIITEETLFAEYQQNRKALPDEYDYSFPAYIENYLIRNNGTLEHIS